MLKQIRLAVLAAAMLLGGAAEARHPVRQSYTSHHSGSSDYYTAHSGHRVHRPVRPRLGQAPSAATAPGASAKAGRAPVRTMAGSRAGFDGGIADSFPCRLRGA
jgi:hypothetical protein